MKIGGNTLQIFNLLIKAVIVSGILRVGTDRNKTVFGNDQLTDKIHQYIKLLNIYADGSAHCRLSRFLFRFLFGFFFGVLLDGSSTCQSYSPLLQAPAPWQPPAPEA